MDVDWFSSPFITSDIELLISKSLASEKLERICFHRSTDSKLHVMLICIPPQSLYPTHFHKTNDEWYFVLKGELFLEVFGGDNKREEILLKSSGQSFFPCAYLMEAKVPHTTFTKSHPAVFFEVRNGPFDKNDTVFTD